MMGRKNHSRRHFIENWLQFQLEQDLCEELHSYARHVVISKTENRDKAEKGFRLLTASKHNASFKATAHCPNCGSRKVESNAAKGAVWGGMWGDARRLAGKIRVAEMYDVLYVQLSLDLIVIIIRL